MPGTVASAPELVNPVPADAAGAWVRSMAATFLTDPDAPSVVRDSQSFTRRWDPERTWGLVDRGRFVGTLRTEARALTVPGAWSPTLELPVDAVTNVTVAATHRRRGLMRLMLEASLRAARERGDAISALIAAEWPIYGRFGFAPATLSATYEFRRTLEGAVVAGEVAGVRELEREEFGRVAPAVFDAARRMSAGQMNRSADWWSRRLGLDGFPVPDELPHHWLVHEGEAGLDGLLAWSASGEPNLIPPRKRVQVWGLVSAGDAAYRDLWAYLCGIDGADEVTVSERPIAEPVRWLLRDARTLVTTKLVDFLWLRLLDVPAALCARRYAVPGEVVLEVRDPHAGGFAAGRYRLEADGMVVACEREGARAADLELPQAALASIYLGGFRLTELLAAGVVVERTPGAAALVDLMFSTPAPPWNATWF